MTNFFDTFRGQHGDFETLFHDTDLDRFVIRYHPKVDGIDDGSFACYKVIAGFTALDNGDTMLHLIDAEGADTPEDIRRNANSTGIQFMLLSTLLNAEDGFHIYPSDQLEGDEEIECALTSIELEDELEIEVIEDEDDDEPEIYLNSLGRAAAAWAKRREELQKRAEFDNYAMYDGDKEFAEGDDFDEYEAWDADEDDDDDEDEDEDEDDDNVYVLTAKGYANVDKFALYDYDEVAAAEDQYRKYEPSATRALMRARGMAYRG